MNIPIQYTKGPELGIINVESICEVLDRQTALTPAAPAVVDSSGVLTYADLTQASDKWAKTLVSMGVRSDDTIAIMLPRSKDYLTLIFAVMKSGAAFLPLDANYPPERLNYMIKSSGAKFLITNQELYASQPIRIHQVFFADQAYTLGSPVKLPRVKKNQRAYIIYTSGSTGTPKGVAVSHKALVALISWFGPEIFHCTSHDRFCAVNSFSFDASIVDFFPAIAAGASVYIVSEETKNDLSGLRQFIIDHQLTLGVFTTRFGFALLDGYALPLKAVVLAGEKLNTLPRTQCVITNGYGPTEFTVCSNFHTIRQAVDPIPIGRPAPNSYNYVLDDELRLLPPGEIGELYLSGVQLSDGYVNDNSQTQERFITNPFATSEDTRKMYRTGDLVRWNPEGQLEYIGRKDAQVKVRGYRIDLSEIENHIKSFDGIMDAVAIVRERNHNPHIYGYYVCKYKKVSKDNLEQYLAAKLPRYALPSFLIEVPALPLTVNGKLDASKLPLPQISFIGDKAANKEEQTLLSIVIKLMDTPTIGVTDNLLESGMDSISILCFTAAANQADIIIRIADVYQYKTIRSLVANRHKESPIARWVNMDSFKPLVVVISGATPACMLDALIKELETHFSVLLFDPITDQYQGNESKANFHDWIEMYLEHLQHQVTGKQQILAFTGHCLGGEFAFALAKRWNTVTGHLPKIWIFNSIAKRETEKTDYHWSLTPIQHSLFKEWLAVAHIANQLINLREIPTYEGEVIFFFANQFTPNLLLPELPPMTSNARELDLLREGEILNIKNWNMLAPSLHVIPVNATHWTLFSPENLEIIIKHLTN